MLIVKHDCKTNYDYSSKNPNRICCVEGCQQLGQDVTPLRLKVQGKIRRRKYCSTHFRADLAERSGVDSFTHILAKNKGVSVTEYRRNIVENVAANKGMTVTEYRNSIIETAAASKGVTVTAYRRSIHKSRRHILDYCENIDGRLGFKCTTTIIVDCGMLHGDHKNGVPWDHRPSNLQTLCSCCHSYKSHIFKDYASVGRRTAKSLTEEEKLQIQEEADLRYKETFERFTAANNSVKVM
jgi:hypothetical protein